MKLYWPDLNLQPINLHSLKRNNMAITKQQIDLAKDCSIGESDIGWPYEKAELTKSIPMNIPDVSLDLAIYISNRGQEIFLGISQEREVLLNTKKLYEIIKTFNDSKAK